jgi:prepilin-type N-terminal cleavage/methylation domain-containing protein
MKRFDAFTLAEILITLGIIGIVAAIVIPNLMANYEKKQITPMLKKTYTTVKQGVDVSQVINAAPETWNYNLNASDFYDEYARGYYLEADHFPLSRIDRVKVDYRNMDGSVATDPVLTSNDSVAIVLQDSAWIIISNEKDNGYKTIAIDINGQKRPNIIGKDIFLFTIQGKYGLTPYGYANGGVETFGTKYSKTVLLNSNPYGCKHNGAYCAAYVMSMNWQMDEDYPR